MKQGSVLKILSFFTLSLLVTTANAENTKVNNTFFYISPLYLQPSSNNLKYAVFVSGNQPLHQSWHNQVINPSYSPAFELGFNYGCPHSTYSLSMDWLYLNSNDSSSKQALENTDVATVQFVAPPYDVGPGVFGIKRADSNVNFNFNSLLLNVSKIFEYCPGVLMRVFGGLNILHLNQTLTTKFSDYVGSPPIPLQAYELPADPRFYFQTQNVSQYFGAGPDLGVNIQYKTCNGLGVVGQFLGTLTAGSIHAKDNFTSASARLLAAGINTSYQAITAPSTTEVVPGFDSKLGLFFNHAWGNCLDLTVEAGYRFAYYINAISQIYPDTLVQAGPDPAVPEFATGTMAINSTASSYSPFSMQGPYINFILNIA